MSLASEWNSLNALEAASVLSITGFVMKSMGCPLCWVSNLQTEISLSTTKAEHVALSYSMSETLALMYLLK